MSLLITKGLGGEGRHLLVTKGLGAFADVLAFIEQFTITDTFSPSIGFYRNLIENLQLQHILDVVLTEAVIILQYMFEHFELTQQELPNVFYVAHFKREPREDITFLDVITSIFNYNPPQLFVESLTIVDDLLTTSNILRFLIDNYNITDKIAKSYSKRLIADPLTIYDFIDTLGREIFRVTVYFGRKAATLNLADTAIDMYFKATDTMAHIKKTVVELYAKLLQ